MAGFGSPCGACKFLRRKCVQGCVFAPYFRHEQGAAHFAAIHRVFGASNASKLLTHLPASDRCEAAVTISYEAQARLQDPIYGCVAHIFALQRQVVTLQAQLASLKAQAAQGFANGMTSISNIVEDINSSNKFQGFFEAPAEEAKMIQTPELCTGMMNPEAISHHESTAFVSRNSSFQSPQQFFSNEEDDWLCALMESLANGRRSTTYDHDSRDLYSGAFAHLHHE